MNAQMYTKQMKEEIQELTIFDEGFTLFKKCMSDQMKLFMDDKRLELLYIVVNSAYSQQYFVPERGDTCLRQNMLIFADGSMGKGKTLRIIDQIYKNIDIHKTELSSQIVSSSATDKFVLGGRDLVKVKIKKPDLNRLRHERDSFIEVEDMQLGYLPGYLERCSLFLWEEGTDLFNSNFHGERRNSTILNALEKNTYENNTGEALALCGKNDFPMNAVVIAASIPNVVPSQQLIEQNALARFHILYLQSDKSKTLSEVYTDEMSAEFTPALTNNIDENIVKYSEFLKTIYTDKARKKMIHIPEIAFTYRRAFTTDKELFEMLDEVSRTYDERFVNHTSGYLRRQIRARLMTLAINICILNKDTKVQKKHVQKAYDMININVASFIQFYDDNIRVSNINRDKHKVTINTTHLAILHLVTQYYRDSRHLHDREGNPYISEDGKKEIRLLTKMSMTDYVMEHIYDPKYSASFVKTRRTSIISIIRNIDFNTKDTKVLRGEKNTSYIVSEEFKPTAERLLKKK